MKVLVLGGAGYVGGAVTDPSEDHEVVELAIRRALSDNELVNQAAERNYGIAEERLDQSILKPKEVEIYTTVAKEKGIVYEN